MSLHAPAAAGSAHDRGTWRGASPDEDEAITRPEALAAIRESHALLLAACARVPEDRWAERPSPAWSPIGWHLGHAAATLDRWLSPGARPDHAALFDPFVTAKGARAGLPAPAALRCWLAEAIERAAWVLERGWPLARGAPGLPPSFLALHLAQHGWQHAEHALVIGALLAGTDGWGAAAPGPRPAPGGAPARVHFDGGPTAIGAGAAAWAYDNERPRHAIALRPFWIDARPTTVAEFAQFVAEGGYRDDRLWTQAGAAARAREGWQAPRGWLLSGQGRYAHPQGPAADGLPVTGLGAHEAEAYARWRGARLPTEEEWERAAGPHAFPGGQRAPTPAEANVAERGAAAGLLPVASFAPSGRGLFDLAGNAWEWTASDFAPWPGFRAYPYEGYSMPWFGPDHRVLRGGSWATAARLCRRTFRNFYPPRFREVPATVRCAGDLP